MATSYVDLTLDGTEIVADKALLTNTTLNVVNNAVPENIKNGLHNASDGVTKIDIDDFIVQDNSRIFVKTGAELDLTESDEVIFKNNILTGNNDGGAINVAANGKLLIDGAAFVGNETHDGGFGGSIWNKGDASIKNATFTDGFATSGGAVGGSSSSTGNLYIENSTFSDNHAEDGGAVSAFNKIEIKDSTFTNNTAMYAQDKYGEWTIKMPTNNNPIGGGALALGAESESAIASVTKTTFVNNRSGYNGGAIGTRLAQSTDGKNSLHSNTATLDIAATFIENFAENDGGAIYSTFYNNNDSGNGDGVTVTGEFEENEAGRFGGAIFNDGRHDSHERGGVMTVYGATFDENIAGDSGGAIYNTGTLTVKNTVFDENEANRGGAIYNSADGVSLNLNDVKFVDNYAAQSGGAIYNEAGATIVLGGTENIFAENTVGKRRGSNDIHNDGTLNITADKTVIGGGITGTGTLSLAAGATLDIGVATIEQDILNIDGTVQASIVNDRSYGRLLGDVIAGDNAILELNVGAVGTYKMFGTETNVKVVVGDAYVATATTDGIVIETKAVEDLAADTGLTTQSAGMVAGLANSDDKSVQKISLMIQEALNKGDIALVEKETAKMNPADTPVAQSVSTSVQSQVLSLTAGRMGGGVALGRSGGNGNRMSGFWLHGLFNKTKLDNQFHGYTRGFALGADTVIDRVWTLGTGFAYNNTDVHADAGRDTNIDSKTLFLYGQYKPNKWYANATLTYSMSEYTDQATVMNVLTSNTYDVDSYGAQFMTGIDFASGVTTEIGARYLRVSQDEYANMFGGTVLESDTEFLSGVAGLKYAFTIQNNSKLKWRPELRAAATYDFMADDAVSTVVMPGNVSYQVVGDSLSKLGGEFGVGLTADYKGMEVSLMYDLDLHKDYTSQTGMIKFRGWF